MSNLIGKSINCGLYTLSDDINDTNSSHIASIKAVNTVNVNKINLTGSRGTLAGNETVSVVSGSQTITINSPDTIVINTSGATTLTFTAADINTTAVKVIALKNGTTTSTITISGAVWANNGEAPTWGSANTNLVLVATFIAGRVVINTFDNDDSA